MQTALDEDWRTNRGMEIVSVAVASISYTDDSTKLINMRNEGAMLSDPGVREGYVQGSLARGMEAAGKNEGGAMSGFYGRWYGHECEWQLLCASVSKQTNNKCKKNKTSKTHKELQTLGLAHNVGLKTLGSFCSNCGTPKPTNEKPKLEMKCSECSEIVDLSNGIPKFCPHCGKTIPRGSFISK